jgi:hypothetical protein
MASAANYDSRVVGCSATCCLFPQAALNHIAGGIPLRGPIRRAIKIADVVDPPTVDPLLPGQSLQRGDDVGIQPPKYKNLVVVGSRCLRIETCRSPGARSIAAAEAQISLLMIVIDCDSMGL